MMKSLFLALVLVAFAPFAFAVPGTYTITIGALTQEGSDVGTPDGYRVYQGCDLAAQSVTSVVADPAVAGSDYEFAGESDAPPVLCAIPFIGSTEGGFTNAVSLAPSQLPPGNGTLFLQGCEFVTDTGERFTCSVEVQ